MIYNEFKGLKLPALGFGGMRLPTTNDSGPICEKTTAEMVEYAFKNGVNYFDTAFFYHAGQSEVVLGKVLANYPRDSFFLADKFPGNFMEYVDGKLAMDVTAMGMDKRTYNNAKEIFEHQLKTCGVDYFDFFMLHQVSEITYDLYTNEELGLVEYLLEEKKAGRIKHLGMSSHGRYETINKFLTKYDCIEYVMIQLNYLDWTLQEAGKKYEVLKKHNKPIFVMEPVRGGLLAAPGADAEAILKKARPNDSPVSWAFRFLQSLPEVVITISGMSNMDQIIENVDICKKLDPTSESEKAILQQVVDGMASFVPCTSCRYCCGACPQKLDIPMLIATYNEANHEVSWYVEEVLEALDESKRPQACTACALCNPRCPQDIDIPDTFAKFCELLK